MPRCQCKNTTYSNQVNMSSLDPSYPTTVPHPAYTNMAEAQEKDFKTNYVKIAKVFTEEMTGVLKEIQANTRTHTNREG